MEISQLRYFATVARTQHLTRAAEELNISQPALSKAIARLEDELGTPLFERTPNRILLNSSGRSYLEYVMQALSVLDGATATVRQEAGILEGEVCIMTSCSGMQQSAIRDFIRTHKEVRYRQLRYSSSQMLDQLESGEVDFAVTTKPSSAAQCIWRPLLSDSLYVVTSPEHPLYQRDSITMEELVQENLIISNNLLSIHDIVLDAFRKRGMRPRVAYELNNPPLIEELLQNNRGVAFMPGIPTEQRTQVVNGGRRMIPVVGDPFRYEVGILRLNSRFQRPVAALLEQFLADWFADADHTSPRGGTTNVI